MTPEQRKEQSERLLLAEGIPINSFLPCIEAESETVLRGARDVGIRLLCLFCVAGKAFDPSSEVWKQYLERHQLRAKLSPKEQHFFDEPSQAQALQLTWRCEAMVALQWAVGLFEDLSLPRHETNTEAIIERLPAFNDPPEPFLQSLTLRSAAEILDASDRIYRTHWAVRDATLNKRSVPGQLHSGIVQEWHHAINWLTCYNDADWDEVSTDT